MASIPLPTPDRPLRLGTPRLAAGNGAGQYGRRGADRRLWHRAEAIEIVPMTATGDKIQDRALAEVGGKALWTRELDAALDGGRIDIAVHSLKDVETCVIRASRSAPCSSAPTRATGWWFATGSRLRRSPTCRTARGWVRAARARAAQVRRLRPDLETTLLRGNVATRLGKLAAGEVDATLLAAAGLERLGMHAVGTVQPAEDTLARRVAGRDRYRMPRRRCGHAGAAARGRSRPTHRAVAAERAFLAALGGDCRSPVAAYARWLADGTLRLDAENLSEDGADHSDRRDAGARSGRSRSAGAASAGRGARIGAAPVRGMTESLPLLVTRPTPAARRRWRGA
ncbi:hypothetical protein, partial [Sphingopyxis terrae]